MQKLYSIAEEISENYKQEKKYLGIRNLLTGGLIVPAIGGILLATDLFFSPIKTSKHIETYQKAKISLNSLERKKNLNNIKNFPDKKGLEKFMRKLESENKELINLIENKKEYLLEMEKTPEIEEYHQNKAKKIQTAGYVGIGSTLLMFLGTLGLLLANDKRRYYAEKFPERSLFENRNQKHKFINFKSKK